MKYLPKAKTENIVVQTVNGETLIYDLTTNQAFCLNETSAKVYQACDGATTFDDLKTAGHFDDDNVIYLALDQLKTENLLATGADYVSPLAGMNRRQVIRKIGLASMIALPLISMLIAPPAAHATSAQAALGQPCSRATGPTGQGNCVPNGTCSGNPGICQTQGSNCACRVPADCAVQTTCPSLVNCNSFFACAP